MRIPFILHRISPMPSKKPLVAAVAVAAVSAGSWAALGTYAGTRVEQAMNEQYQALAKVPFIEVRKRDYVRTLTGATDETTLALGCPNQMLPGELGLPAGFEVTVRNRIAHGPFVDGKLGAARIDTEIVIPDKARQVLAALFEDKRPASMVTHVALNGAIEQVLEISPMRFDDAVLARMLRAAGYDEALPPLGSRMEWGGLRSATQLTADGEQMAYAMKLQPLTMTEPNGGRFSMSEVNAVGKGKRIHGFFYDDDGRMTMPLLRIDLPAIPGDEDLGRPERRAMSLVMEDVEATSRFGIDRGYLGQSQSLTVGRLAVDDRKLGKLDYATSFEGLHVATLVEAIKPLMEGGIGCAGIADGSLERRIEPLFEGFKEAGLKLLEHEMRFGVDRLALTTPEGEARMSYQVRFGGIKRTDLEDPEAILQKLTVSADVGASESMLTEFVGMAVSEQMAVATGEQPSAEEIRDMVEMVVGEAVQQGMAQRANGRLSSSFELKRGELKINGRKIDAPVAAIAGAAMAQAEGSLR